MTVDVEFPRREFYMVRHGQTEHNKKRVLSSTYTLLTPEGQEQAAALKELHDLHPEKDKFEYVSSAAPRAIETCRIMTGDKDHRCVEALNERTTGRASGLMTGGFLEKIWQDPAYITKNSARLKKIGIQTHEEHATIVIPAVCAVLEACPANKIPMIVSHGGTMLRTAEFLGGHAGMHFNNAQLYHFKPVENDPAKWEITNVVLENGKIVEHWDGMQKL